MLILLLLIITVIILDQQFPISGPRATCGAPDNFCGPRSFLCRPHRASYLLFSFGVDSKNAEHPPPPPSRKYYGPAPLCMWPAKYLPMEHVARIHMEIGNPCPRSLLLMLMMIMMMTLLPSTTADDHDDDDDDDISCKVPT
ncbi:hypothetical protein M8J77_023184 [Diaphorina citri]|nr:hypothetical protein M8J77_023184 [Diaphorina citri]